MDRIDALLHDLETFSRDYKRLSVKSGEVEKFRFRTVAIFDTMPSIIDALRRLKAAERVCKAWEGMDAARSRCKCAGRVHKTDCPCVAATDELHITMSAHKAARTGMEVANG